MDTQWAEVDESALARDEVDYVVQVNGKLRDHLTAPATADNAALQEMALAYICQSLPCKTRGVERLSVYGQEQNLHCGIGARHPPLGGCCNKKKTSEPISRIFHGLEMSLVLHSGLIPKVFR